MYVSCMYVQEWSPEVEAYSFTFDTHEMYYILYDTPSLHGCHKAIGIQNDGYPFLKEAHV